MQIGQHAYTVLRHTSDIMHGDVAVTQDDVENVWKSGLEVIAQVALTVAELTDQDAETVRIIYDLAGMWDFAPQPLVRLLLEAYQEAMACEQRRGGDGCTGATTGH